MCSECSRLLQLIQQSHNPNTAAIGTPGYYQVKLDPSTLERFAVWMDTYAQRLGSFSADQERRLEELRRALKVVPMCAGRPECPVLVKVGFTIGKLEGQIRLYETRSATAREKAGRAFQTM